MKTFENNNASIDFIKSTEPDQLFTKHHLPHFTNFYYFKFITISTKNILLNNKCKDKIFESLIFWDNKKYDLIAFVIMIDHIHLIIELKDKLTSILRTLKNYMTDEINNVYNRKFFLWQEASYDRIIKNENDLIGKINYIINDPVRSNFSNSSCDYKWLYIKYLSDFNASIDAENIKGNISNSNIFNLVENI